MAEKLIRMVHPTDPRARADGYEHDKDGAHHVPESDVGVMMSHGFAPEPIAEKGQRALEAAAKAERRRILEQRRLDEGF